MTESDRLKLAAIDEEDLAVVSAHVQDAVLKVGDLVYLPRERRFAIGMNRYAWEHEDGKGSGGRQRRRAALVFDQVTAVRTSGVDRSQTEAVLELLAVAFEPTDPPAGRIVLYFAGGGAVQIDVDVIEARLADLGAAWAAKARPAHDIEGETKPQA
jgi:hypothetical protein